MRDKEISGYTYGTEAAAESPVSREDSELLKRPYCLLKRIRATFALRVRL